MRQLCDSVSVDAPPEHVWAWLATLSEHYTEWHTDHVSAAWEVGEPNRVGSVLKAVEVLGGRRETHRFEVVSTDPPHRFEYRILGPVHLLLPRCSFEVTPENGGSRFDASISYRFGRWTERLFRRRVGALKRHMREEGENLRRAVEGRPS